MRIRKLNILIGILVLILSCENDQSKPLKKLNESNVSQTSPRKTIDQTINCWDKKGTPFQYNIKYNIDKLNGTDVVELESVVRSIVQERTISFVMIDDIVINRDSVENILVNEIKKGTHNMKTNMDSLVMEIQIPNSLKEILLLRYPELDSILSRNIY